MTAWLAVLAPVVEDIRDLRGPIELRPDRPWWPYIAAALAIVLSIIAVAAMVRRRRRRRLPADLEALRALEATRAQIDAADANAFSTDVSAAVRGYVEAAFALHAPTWTTEELLAQLMTDSSPVAAHRPELGAFLAYCDLAKYARWSLSRTEMTGMLDTAEAFVRATAGGAA